MFSKKMKMIIIGALIIGISIGGIALLKSNSSVLNNNVLYDGVLTNPNSNKFSWDNATVYFALTDRFNNGDKNNDYSYGRGLDENGKIIEGYNENPGAFQGGDLKGLTQKIKEGYFTNLGVNAIWISAPYEQIHGYVSGNEEGKYVDSNGKGFSYYSYHGYWTLDYTNIDANMGTKEDFKNFVDEAHKKNIRVVMDVVLNHVGYATLKDADEYDYGKLKDGWKDYYYGPIENIAGNKENSYYDIDSSKWKSNWWGPDFIRSSNNLKGYPETKEGNGYKECLAGIPDIKTESEEEVALPPLLENKWKKEERYDKEMASLDEFFNKRNLPKTPRNYVIKWLTDYIREYGIDGFRCDTANHVDKNSWKALNDEAKIAFKEYKEKNPDKVLDKDAEFWTVAEAYGHGANKDYLFTNAGFDALINFSFKGANTSNIKNKYDALSKVNEDDSFNLLSYISSHDDALSDRDNTIDGGTSLLLAPGAVQIFYGDETARPYKWKDRFTTNYADQCYRSFMNWDDLKKSSSKASKSLEHWQKVGQFRNNHIAVGAGENIDISDSPYVFGRRYNKNGIDDKVVCEVGGSGKIVIDVSKVFSDGTKVRDAYTGKKATVKDGKVILKDGGNKVILIEEVK